MTVTKLLLSSFILVTYYFPRILKYHHQHRNAFQSPTLYLICRIVIQSLNHYWWVYCQWCIISKVQYYTVTKILAHFNNRHYTWYFELSYSHQTIFRQVSASVALFLIYSTIQSPNHISPTISQSQLLETFTNRAHHGVIDSATVSNPLLSITFLFFRADFSIGLGILAMPLGLPRLFGAANGGQYLNELFVCCSSGKVFISVSMSKYSIPESTGYCSCQQSVIHQYGMQLYMVRSVILVDFTTAIMWWHGNPWVLGKEQVQPPNTDPLTSSFIK